MARKVKVETCKFVCASDLVPKRWREWFWETISHNAPFSWGDNNRTLVDAVTFHDHCGNRILGEGYVADIAFKAWLQKITRIPADVYIDLEN